MNGKNVKDVFSFSKQLAWWDIISLDLEKRKQIVGLCIRPRDNFRDYLIFRTKNKKSYQFYRSNKRQVIQNELV